MTRLTSRDIDGITDNLVDYDRRLVVSTERLGVLGIACHRWGTEIEYIKQRMASFTVRIIPVTAGLGVISNFTDTVVAILSFLVFSGSVSSASDVAGLAQAMEEGVDGIFMADDATGKVFAAALNPMAGGFPVKISSWQDVAL